jgi:LysM repeat protein
MNTHTVQNGESLSLISKQYFGDFSMIDAIARLNNITNVDVIYPGMILELPIAEGKEVAKAWVKLDRAAIITGVLLAGVSTYFAYKTYERNKKKKAALGAVAKRKMKGK